MTHYFTLQLLDINKLSLFIEDKRKNKCQRLEIHSTASHFGHLFKRKMVWLQEKQQFTEIFHSEKSSIPKQAMCRAAASQDLQMPQHTQQPGKLRPS